MNKTNTTATLLPSSLLKPYPTLKDSRVDWLGKVPAHWVEKRAKYFYRESDERSATGDEELMSVSHKTGVTPRKQSVTMFMAESTVGYKICRADDVAINTMWAFMGALGVARQVGLVSPSYGVYRPTRPGMLIPEYIDRVLRIDGYKSEFMCRSTGINSSRLRLYPDEFLRIPIICPPPEEQAAIVRYLDHVDRRVRRLVRAKRKLIALLTAQKQAVIHRAVTRGLDPDVPLKDSGVECLGAVPENWELKRLKSIAHIRYGLGQPPRETSDGLPFIRATNVERGRIVEKDLLHVDPADVPSRRNAILSEGEIIVVRSGAYTADSAIVPKKYAGAVAGYDMVVFVSHALPRFIAQVLMSPYVLNDQLIVASMRSAQPHLNAEELGVAQVLVPPKCEQAEIVEHLNKATTKIDTAINRANREIELLSEYRTRLTADVVTGKLDVREVAAVLPEVDPLAVDDELDDALNTDTEVDVDELNAIPEETEA